MTWQGDANYCAIEVFIINVIQEVSQEVLKSPGHSFQVSLAGSN
jgi:hypothetical protein